MSTTEKQGEMPTIKKSKADELFTLVKVKNTVKIAIGNYQISKREFKSFQQAEDYIRTKPYEILVNVASFVANQTIEMQSHENSKENSKDA